MTQPTLTLVLWAVLSVALLASVVSDLVTRRIFDAVTYPALGVSLALRLWRQGWGDLEHGLISGLVSGAGAAGLFAVLAWRGRGFGWGDVKLMGAVGAALGYPLAVAALVFISLVGALQAVVTLIWQGAVWETLGAAVARLAARAHLARSARAGSPVAAGARQIPYGVAIALGTFWAMWWEQSGQLGLGSP